MLGNCQLLQDEITSEGRHLVLDYRKRRHRMLIMARHSEGSNYIVPGDLWLRTRLTAIEAFDASCREHGRSKSDDALFPSAYQKHRLTLLLNILDTVNRPDKDVVTIRDIAQHVVYRNADFGRTIEWKSSSHRRQTQRLLNQAHFYVRGGYRLLLEGRTHQTSSNSYIRKRQQRAF